MRTAWELIAERPGGSVTSLVSAGVDVLATTPAGVRSSADSGRTWQVCGPALMPPLEVAVPAPTGGLVLAGSASGLYRSTDRGATWTSALVGSRVLTIAFGSDELVLVGTEDDGVLRSEDAGVTWRSGNPGLLDLTVVGLACSVDFADDQTAYAATASGVFQTRNAGRAWRAVDTFPETVPQSVIATRRSVLVGTEASGLFRSSDGGATWAAASLLDGRSVTALSAAHDGRLAAATDVGVAESDDDGLTWHWCGESLGPVLSVTYAPDGTLLAGLPRTGIRRWTAHDWASSDDGLRANLMESIAVTSQGMYVACLEQGLIVSRDGGVTWQSTGSQDVVAAFALTADAAYAATSAGVLRRRGDAFEVVNSTPVRSITSRASTVGALTLGGELILSETDGWWRSVPLPSEAGVPSCLELIDPDTLVIGSSSGLWLGNEAAWQRTLDASPVTAVAAAPDGRLLAAVGDRVWTQQGPSAWRHASVAGSIPALAPSLTFARDRVIVVATSAGVYISTDAGASFARWRDGIGEPAVVAVAFSPEFAADGIVYAVELGGRIWRARVS